MKSEELCADGAVEARNDREMGGQSRPPLQRKRAVEDAGPYEMKKEGRRKNSYWQRGGKCGIIHKKGVA